MKTAVITILSVIVFGCGSVEHEGWQLSEEPEVGSLGTGQGIILLAKDGVVKDSQFSEPEILLIATGRGIRPPHDEIETAFFQKLIDGRLENWHLGRTDKTVWFRFGDALLGEEVTLECITDPLKEIRWSFRTGSIMCRPELDGLWVKLYDIELEPDLPDSIPISISADGLSFAVYESYRHESPNRIVATDHLYQTPD